MMSSPDRDWSDDWYRLEAEERRALHESASMDPQSSEATPKDQTKARGSHGMRSEATDLGPILDYELEISNPNDWWVLGFGRVLEMVRERERGERERERDIGKWVVFVFCGWFPPKRSLFSRIIIIFIFSINIQNSITLQFNIKLFIKK